MAAFAMLACNSPADFRGLGGIEIGKQFDLIPESASFRKVMKNEYYVQDYKLGDNIGMVSKLSVTTNDDGKIVQVKFSESEKTNVGEIEKSLSALKPIENTLVQIPEDFEIKGYMTPDSTIFVGQTTSRYSIFKDGKPRREFQYSSQEALKQRAEEAKQQFVSLRKAKG